MARALVTVPPSPRRGEPMEIRALIQHPMETGYRPGADGRVLPRDILRRFTCRYNGELVFAAEMFPAVSANPYLSFWTLAVDSGVLEFEWQGDNGFAQVERVTLSVA
ncbi:thiosulfate oxidation carrier complex protein SoxZ [Ramlibacter sp.]|uniref:thiosulfate oxidation carrier complex protein SoxZ n=1 Tax=Ramlibacter sp. TaxID=1917967 RepID=UPI003D099F4D